MAKNETGMPQHLEDTALADAWNDVRSLAQEQGVNPETDAVKVEEDKLSPETLAALAAVGGANIENDERGFKVKLSYADQEDENDSDREDPSIVAASKPHTFA